MLVTCLWYGLCSSSVHDRGVAFPRLVGFAFVLRAVPLSACVGPHSYPTFSRVSAAPSPGFLFSDLVVGGILPPCSFSSVFLRDVVTLSGH